MEYTQLSEPVDEHLPVDNNTVYEETVDIYKYENTDNVIPPPEHMSSTIAYKIVEYECVITYVFIVPTSKLNTEMFNLSKLTQNTHTHLDIVIVVLYIDDSEIQELDIIEDDQVIHLDTLHVLITKCKYYVMIEIDKESVSDINTYITSCSDKEQDVIFWPIYASPVATPIMSGIAGIVFNLKIQLTKPIIISLTFDAFKHFISQEHYMIIRDCICKELNVSIMETDIYDYQLFAIMEEKRPITKQNWEIWQMIWESL